MVKPSNGENTEILAKKGRMNPENYRVEIIRGASVGTALGIVIGHRFGLIIGLIIGFISAILMANPIRVWQAIIEITGKVSGLVKHFRLAAKKKRLPATGQWPAWPESTLNTFIKLLKDLGYVAIGLGTFLLLTTQPHLIFFNDPEDIVMWVFGPVIAATFGLIGFIALIVSDYGIIADITSTKDKLLWPCCKMLNNWILDDTSANWENRWKRIGLNEFRKRIVNKIERLENWLSAKSREKGACEKDVSADRISALLCTVFLVLFMLTIGSYLVISYCLFFISLFFGAILLDIPVMFFLKIATRPALAAGEGAVFAILLEGLVFAKFNSHSFFDWTRLLVFSAVGCLIGLSSYALRQHLLFERAPIKAT